MEVSNESHQQDHDLRRDAQRTVDAYNESTRRLDKVNERLRDWMSRDDNAHAKLVNGLLLGTAFGLLVGVLIGASRKK